MFRPGITLQTGELFFASTFPVEHLIQLGRKDEEKAQRGTSKKEGGEKSRTGRVRKQSKGRRASRKATGGWEEHNTGKR